MTRINRLVLVMAGACFVAATCLPVLAADAAADKVNVLIIDGQNGHNWKETTPVLKELLLKTGRFNVEVLTSPDAKASKEDWDKFKPDFTKCNVVLTNYCGAAWPADVQKGIVEFVNNGGGLVFYHFAVASFPQWEAWNKFMGMGWRGDPKFGDRLSVDDSGKVVRTPKGEGPGAGHGDAHPFEMTVRDKEHPVMQGMPQTWTHMKDELYHGVRGPAQDVQILATAFDDPKFKGTGTNEPLVWTVPAGKGRVFVTLLGHDGGNTAAVDAAAIMARGCEWAATGKVTIPAPKEIPAPAAAPAATK
jgi:uncharacterized protein